MINMLSTLMESCSSDSNSNTDMMRRVVGQRLVLSQERCWVLASKALLRAVAVVFWRLLVKCSKINVDKISDLMNKIQVQRLFTYY